MSIAVPNHFQCFKILTKYFKKNSLPSSLPTTKIILFFVDNECHFKQCKLNRTFWFQYQKRRKKMSCHRKSNRKLVRVGNRLDRLCKCVPSGVIEY